MERHQAYMQVKPSVIKRDTVRKNKGHASLLGLVLAVIALLLLSFVLMENKVASSMDSVTLAGLLIVVIWTGLLGVKRDNSLPAFKPVLKKSMRAYWHHGITSGASLAPFFVGIGTFTYGFQHSTVSTQIVATLTPLFAQLGWWLVLLIPIIVVLVSLIGIHPLASVALIGKVIMAMHISLSPLLIALSLNIGSVAAYMLSPFAGIVMIVATLLNVSPGTVSIRWNWQFCSLFLVLSIIVAILLNLVF